MACLGRCAEGLHRGRGEAEGGIVKRVGKYFELGFDELLILDELISGDFGRDVKPSGDIAIYDNSAQAYTPTELCSLLGLADEALDTYLAERWVEHDIASILSGAGVVRLKGEGILLTPELRGPSSVSWCRLFTPELNWRPRDRQEVAELEKLLSKKAVPEKAE